MHVPWLVVLHGVKTLYLSSDFHIVSVDHFHDLTNSPLTAGGISIVNHFNISVAITFSTP